MPVLNNKKCGGSALTTVKLWGLAEQAIFLHHSECPYMWRTKSRLLSTVTVTPSFIYYLISNMCVQCPVPSVPSELPSVYVEILVPVNVYDFHVNFYPMILPCGAEWEEVVTIKLEQEKNGK